MEQTFSVSDQWIHENNETVTKCQQELDRDVTNRDHHLKLCSFQFHKLLRKIQGVPAHAEHTHLELAVVYNTCLCSAAQAQFSEAQLLLSQAADRVLQCKGANAQTADVCVQWKLLLQSTENTFWQPSVVHLLCVQWALWLATHQLKRIETLEEVFSSLREQLHDVFEDVGGSKSKEKPSKRPQLVAEPRRLVELLHICTVIIQSAEKIDEGRHSEALSALQAASTLPAHRALLAHTHLLSGFCLAHMKRPQMALQCYKKALETDSGSVCALYQSARVYRQLGHTQAEIQALRLLHSILMLPSATQSMLAHSHLLPPALLLSSQSVSSLLSVPSAFSVLHSLAFKCVLHGRVSEGVEHYLDLLALLHTDDHQEVQTHAETQPLPRLPELYLQAGAALLMAQRPADCDALCSEVLSTTLELLPERVLLAEPEEQSEVDGKRLAALLWAAAAYLLQGHCHSHLKEWKQAVTHYTRCINLLVKVRFKKTGLQPQIQSVDMDVKWGKDMNVLQRMKGLSLCWRGINFAQTAQLKEALRDLHLGLQLLPECTGAGLWCGEVLWRLDRKHEAAAFWEKTWNSMTQTLDENLPLYLLEPQSGPLLKSTDLHHRLQELGLPKSD
ncbi:Fanconi anemia group G protein isoform X1 [Gouania willdenowi]|uniref:Fanconi anemia group G protein isoform X1 n=1 Tax=Gouania willdenowi TaxID=441366 RepID=UPI001054C9F2|nr:Fanconi anemia group G protein isoform X1 [Gouania willdenowi]